jgi:hypothetical protein
MDLKQEFLTALQRGDDSDHLLDLVHRHQQGGTPPQMVYDILEGIWLDLGFNNSDEPSALKDNLEYVLEKVWYECPAGGR